MNCWGGLIVILLYGIGQTGSGPFNLLTEAGDDILTQAEDNILVST